METVSLVLPDDHPLVQLGFRGKLRLVHGVQVRVAGVSRRPRHRRRLPPTKRRALVLMAFGFGPVELAERLDLCLERAEALHEELTRKLGLDRIARQVRSAILAGMVTPIGPQPPEIPNRQHPSSDLSRPTGEGASMIDEDLVRVFFPDALAASRGDRGWQIVLNSAARPRTIGEGTTEREAWADASLHLWEDEWFRPILVQLRTMWSEQPGQA
ncbi:hypothetical protein [Tautonia plasticadhaerens]|uniref:Uncharacterized protein n=1 Tax=Tautonia plasticadhaerens TaxID=2527974 RepID=A0A518H7I2_9BACT|nr:hypothetical protein [Tautonia plasticadhaerens]QDV36828.1 hypothetical protein ElP_47570 [Tautonia plasticadhaerens]